ncbi:MAG: PIG-L family deacetylase [Chloroflexi bacterium]|nr:PIG-L family deacetylase [Chloroflexota bacterium]
MSSVRRIAPIEVGPHYRALYVAPHFDDVALSCGGTVVREAEMGVAPLVVTVFAGDPTGPDLTPFARFQHARWGSDDALGERRQEDAAAMAALNADYLWLPFLDAIYRGDQYLSDDELFGPLKPDDHKLVGRLADDLLHLWRQTDGAVVSLPLALGNHVDHQLCRATGAPLRAAGAPLRYYEDVPYALTPGAIGPDDRWLDPELIDVTATMDRRLAAIACYASQLPTIFRHHGPHTQAVRAHAASLAPGAVPVGAAPGGRPCSGPAGSGIDTGTGRRGDAATGSGVDAGDIRYYERWWWPRV